MTSHILQKMERRRLEKSTADEYNKLNVGRLGTLEYNIFRWCAIRLFNQLPLYVRNTTVCSIHSFKKQLDSYLSTVPASPCQPEFNNNLDHGYC